MRIERRVTLVLLVVAASPWALTLTVGGLWLVVNGLPGAEGAGKLAVRSAGLAALAGGQIVFLCCVADRVFPRASRRIRSWVELVMCGALLTSVLAMCGALVVLAT